MAKKCPNCETKTFDVAEKCLNCGYVFKALKHERPLDKIAVIGFIFGLISGLLWQYLLFGLLFSVSGLIMSYEKKEERLAQPGIIINGFFFTATLVFYIYSNIKLFWM